MYVCTEDNKDYLEAAHIAHSSRILGLLAQHLFELFHPSSLGVAGDRGGVILPAPPRSIMEVAVRAVAAELPEGIYLFARMPRLY